MALRRTFSARFATASNITATTVANVRPRRSALYMPGSNARALDKGRSLPCDVLLLDCEDAVSPDNKVLARNQIVEALTAGGFGNRELVVRVNPLASPWGKDDVVAMAEVSGWGVYYSNSLLLCKLPLYANSYHSQTPTLLPNHNSRLGRTLC